MERFKSLTEAFFEKMERQASIDGARLNRPLNWKLRLIAWAIGIAVVVLMAVWMEHH